MEQCRGLDFRCLLLHDTWHVYNSASRRRSLKMLSIVIPLILSVASATITITDPSDVINPADWAADNAILADFNITPTLYQVNAIDGPYLYSNTDVNITHQYLTVDANDTSVLVITESSTAQVENTEIVKFGYGSNLFQESFYGMLSCLQQGKARHKAD